MRYLVVGSGGPGFGAASEAVSVLEGGILEMLDALHRLEQEGVLLGGLPVGDRAFVFILIAASNEEADRLLRRLPAWGVFDWEVTPLHGFDGRAAHEREILAGLKGETG